jgi:glycerophosphoryl diester phosphodiesterase
VVAPAFALPASADKTAGKRARRVVLVIASAAATAAPPGPALSAVEGPASSAAEKPIVIAHRGASGYRPEHTLEAYRLAVEMGADFIEPDLVSTKDGVLIARHENEIGGTTDVADRFPDRKQTKTIDGQSLAGWFTEDFTLAEIKTLRTRERLPFRSRAYDGQFQIPTFAEVIVLAQQLGTARGRPVGVYPETKHPTYFRSIKLPLEEPLIATLEKHGWNAREAPVFIQSFEQANLRELRKKTRVRLVQLAATPALLSDAALKEIASYADGLGPEKRLVIPVNPDGSLGTPTDVVARAHALGLVVHVWTVRVEPLFLPAGYKGNAVAEFEQLRELGVDGVFTDFPDIGVKAYGTASK